MNSVRYCQLLEFINLDISFTWLIPSSVGRLRASEIASTVFMPFKMGMDEVSYIFTAGMSC